MPSTCIHVCACPGKLLSSGMRTSPWDRNGWCRELTTWRVLMVQVKGLYAAIPVLILCSLPFFISCRTHCVYTVTLVPTHPLYLSPVPKLGRVLESRLWSLAVWNSAVRSFVTRLASSFSSLALRRKAEWERLGMRLLCVSPQHANIASYMYSRLICMQWLP